MTNQSNDRLERDERLHEVIAAYLEAVHAGQSPDRSELLARHPDLADDLKAFLADHDKLNQLAEPLRPVAQAAQAPAAALADAPTLPPEPTDPIGLVGNKATDPAVGTRVRYFGDYELLEEIARGGMGVVYKARQVSLKRTVALKMILAGQLASEGDIKRFHAEAEAAAKLDHPNIVPIFEVGDHAGQHYFSMAFVEGESLAHRAAKGVFAPRDAAELMRKIVQAVAYAHVEGVVHRDLKPANVLIDKDGQPRVTDFGLAKRVATQSLSMASGGRQPPDDQPAHAGRSPVTEQLTATGQILGTPSYMPPEQAAGRTKEIGPLSDVYSLGAMLYCLLTGRPPFQAATPLDTILQVLDQEPVSPRLLNASVPRDLETICMKCLQKEPRRRYASAQELADEFQRFLSEEPIHARPTSIAEHAWRWLRKQRRSAVVGTTAAAAAVILVLAGIAAWQHYERSQLGYLQLKSTSPDSPVLVAEVYDENDELAAAPFSVPTKEPVPLVAGSYRVRLSGSGQLSETYLLEVNPGSERTFSVGLGERKLLSPIPVGRPDGFEAVNLDGSVDFILVPLGDTLSMRRVSGATGKTVWEESWNAWDQSNVALAGVLKTQEDRQLWATLTTAWTGPWNGLSRPVLLRTLDETEHSEPLLDINGDGVGDLVWAASASDNPTAPPSPPSLLAVSGKDGTPLWWFRAKTSSGLMQGGSVVGPPVVVETGTGGPRLVALFSTTDESWVEAISATTGESLWRSKIDRQVTADGKPAQLHELRLCSVSGRHVLITITGSRLVGLDAVTGETAWPPHELGLELARAPQVADIDGDGSDDMLLVYLDPTRGRSVTAVSLATRKPLWPTPVQVRYEKDFTPHWPFVVNLGGDGKPVVVLPVRKDVPYNLAWTGLEVLDGATGARRWERRFPINGGMIANMNRAPDRYAAGPDLDGDGQRELFVVSARTDRTERGREALHPSLYSLFVDALSGSDGHTIWWSRIPLGDVLPTTWSSGIGPIGGGPPGPDGWPSLVVPVANCPEQGSETSRTVFVLAASTGQVLHVGQELWPPIAADVNHDGITDLCAFVPDDPRRDLSGNLPNPAGKILMFRGIPPEAWRRLGRWLPAQDLDHDGYAELIEATDMMQPRSIEPVISGRDGHLLATRNYHWGVPGVSAEPRFLGRFPLPFPHGDLNGDGVADLLVSGSHRFFDDARNRPFVDRPGRLFLPLQAISGKTGERLWLSQDIPDPVPGNHAFLQVEPYSPQLVDLDGDGTPEVLCPYSCHYTDKGGFPRMVGVALISGKDGTLRWTQMLEDETVLNKGKGGIANSERIPAVMPTFVDLNVDGVRDVLLAVPIKPDHALELHALDGRDGQRLWQRSLTRRWEANSYPNESPQPLCGDLDGDGRPDVVVLDHLGTSAAGWLTYTVTALDGQSGEPKWIWEYRDHGNWAPPRVVLAELDGDGMRSVCVGLHESSPTNEIVVLGSDGRIQRRFDSGGLVVNNYATSTSEMRIRAADVDGDGKDEFVYITGGKVRATRGGPEQSLWEWPLPGGAGGILEIRPAEHGQHTLVVVEAAGESTIDDWGRIFLESLPPHDGVGTRGDSIYILDGATGKPIWRGRREPTGDTTIPTLSPAVAEVVRLQATSGQRPNSGEFCYRLPTLVSRSSDRTVSRLMLPTRPTGEYLPPPTVASAARTLAADPRLLRHLPWIPRGYGTGAQLAVEFLQPPLFLGFYALLVLGLPGWLLRHAILRRQWTARGLLLVPIAFAVAFAGYKLVVGLPFGPHGEIFLPRSSLPLRLLATLAGLPVLAFPSLLLTWTIRRRWSRVILLVGLSLLISLTISAVALWIDSRSMDSAERYSWNGWYLVLFMGSIAASALTLVGLVLTRIVHLLRTWLIT